MCLREMGFDAVYVQWGKRICDVFFFFFFFFWGWGCDVCVPLGLMVFVMCVFEGDGCL